MNPQQDSLPENANDKEDEKDSIYLNDSNLQTAEEFDKDKHQDHSKEDSSLTIGKTDDLASNSDGAAGTDRAGTAERKLYGDPELNKGLEAQAKDEES